MYLYTSSYTCVVLPYISSTRGGGAFEALEERLPVVEDVPQDVHGEVPSFVYVYLFYGYCLGFLIFVYVLVYCNVCCSYARRRTCGEALPLEGV